MRRLLLACLILLLGLAGSGCQLISQAQRDSDEEDWGEKWSSDDAGGGKHDSRVRKGMIESPEPAKAGKPKAAGPSTPPPRSPAPTPPARQPAPRAVEPAEPVEPVGLVPDKPAVEDAPAGLQLDVEEAPQDGRDPGWQEEPSPIRRRGGPNEFQAAPARADAGVRARERRRRAEPKPEPRPAHVVEEPEKEKEEKPTAPTTTDKNLLEPKRGMEGKDDQPDVVIELDGGILINRGARIQPGCGLGLAWNLGKLLGWPGLYLKGDVDIFIGDSPLGTEYIQLDSGLGFMGRFGLGPVNLLISMEFVLRNAFVTKQAASVSSDPALGFGVMAGLGLDLPITSFMSVWLGGDARYVQDAFTSRFEFSAAAVGGFAFAF